MSTYLMVAVVVYLLFLFLGGKFNYKFKFYRDEEDRLAMVFLGTFFSLFWIITIPLTLVALALFGAVVVSVKLLQYFDK